MSSCQDLHSAIQYCPLFQAHMHGLRACGNACLVLCAQLGAVAQMNVDNTMGHSALQHSLS